MINLSSLVSAQHAFMEEYTQITKEIGEKFGLSFKETDLLSFYNSFPEYDTPAQAVKYRSYSKTYVSKTLDMLMAKGYIVMKQSEDDRRYQHVALTPKAAEIGNELKSRQHEFYRKVLNGISNDDIKKAQEIITRININLNCE